MIDYLTVPGVYMHKADRELIHRLSADVAEIFNPCVIVHIGVEWGGSLYCSRAGAPDCVLYGVDFQGGERLKGPKNLLKAAFLLGDSRDVWKDFQGPIHFLYIDGDHHYDFVRADILNWGSKVVSGGYMALHDCKDCQWAPDVNKAIEYTVGDTWKDCGISGWSRWFRRL